MNANIIIKPRTRPYTICPPRLASAGIWPKGWLNGDKPVIGLCIGTKVIIHNAKPYSNPSKSNDVLLMTRVVKNEAMINGKAIPARVPFRKWKKKTPLKLILSLSFESLNNRLVITWFSCHSNTPGRPQRFHDGISVNVIMTVETIPPNRPISKYDNISKQQ